MNGREMTCAPVFVYVSRCLMRIKPFVFDWCWADCSITVSLSLLLECEETIVKSFFVACYYKAVP